MPKKMKKYSIMRHQQIQTRHYSYKTVCLGSKTYSSVYLLCLIKGFGTEGENRFVCFTVGKHIYRRCQMREQGDYSHMTTLFTLATAEGIYSGSTRFSSQDQHKFVLEALALFTLGSSIYIHPSCKKSGLRLHQCSVALNPRDSGNFLLPALISEVLDTVEWLFSLSILIQNYMKSLQKLLLQYTVGVSNEVSNLKIYFEHLFRS